MRLRSESARAAAVSKTRSVTAEKSRGATMVMGAKPMMAVPVIRTS
jgi:hypothetical protein